jgi:hypothetical protein
LGNIYILRIIFDWNYIRAIISQNLSIYCYLISYKYLLEICYFNHNYSKLMKIFMVGIVVLILLYLLRNIIVKNNIINQLLIIFNLFIIAIYIFVINSKSTFFYIFSCNLYSFLLVFTIYIFLVSNKI